MSVTDHIALLAALVRRPSVNPMGRDVSGPDYLEGRVSDYLSQRFSAAGIPWLRQPVAPGRDNVIARLEATVPDGPVLIWDAHQDTVPVEGMSIEPFVPLVREGRMYGRGTCDVKGGLAAMTAALERLATAPERRATVVLTATVNEEFGFSGALAVTRLWKASGDSPEPAAGDGAARSLLSLMSFMGGRPAVAFVAEPTELDLVVAHKGSLKWRVRVHGRACHGAFPERGENALYAAGRAVLAIESLAAELLARHADHPCGPPTLSLGTLHGGTGVNLVPDLAVLELERRLLPGESAAAARDEIVARIAAACPGVRIEHEPPFNDAYGLPDGTAAPAAAPWVEALAAAAGQRGRGRRTAARYGTNAGVYAAAGVPSVVFGPGSIAQAHTADEWIDLDELAAAVDVLVAVVTGRGV
jgi:acetylornithine deacetylase/succinyl-diaminopimelate desuccinylase-like protein